MRLWTIQNECAAKVIETGEWHSSLDFRSKECDMDQDLTAMGYYPIYTFATLNNDFLNINSLRESFKDIAHKYRLPRSWDDVLIELEVREEDILSMKPVESQTVDPVFYITQDFKNSINDQIEKASDPYSSKLQFPASYECVLESIKKEQVIAIHKFALDPETDSCTLRTTFVQAGMGSPAWARSITINTDGTFRLKRSIDADLLAIKNMYKNVNALVTAKCSATKPTSDMCIKEALEFCNADFRPSLVEKFNRYKTSHDGATMFNTTWHDVEPY